MATPFNDQWALNRARAPGGLEHVGAVTHFDEQGFPLAATHERPLDPDRVADPGEHVGNRIGHHGGDVSVNRRG